MEILSKGGLQKLVVFYWCGLWIHFACQSFCVAKNVNLWFWPERLHDCFGNVLHDDLHNLNLSHWFWGRGSFSQASDVTKVFVLSWPPIRPKDPRRNYVFRKVFKESGLGWGIGQSGGEQTASNRVETWPVLVTDAMAQQDFRFLVVCWGCEI